MGTVASSRAPSHANAFLLSCPLPCHPFCPPLPFQTPPSPWASCHFSFLFSPPPPSLLPGCPSSGVQCLTKAVCCAGSGRQEGISREDGGGHGKRGGSRQPQGAGWQGRQGGRWPQEGAKPLGSCEQPLRGDAEPGCAVALGAALPDLGWQFQGCKKARSFSSPSESHTVESTIGLGLWGSVGLGSLPHTSRLLAVIVAQPETSPRGCPQASPAGSSSRTGRSPAG